jgi:hypothetical protein
MGKVSTRRAADDAALGFDVTSGVIRPLGVARTRD